MKDNELIEELGHLGFIIATNGDKLNLIEDCLKKQLSENGSQEKFDFLNIDNECSSEISKADVLLFIPNSLVDFNHSLLIENSKKKNTLVVAIVSEGQIQLAKEKNIDVLKHLDIILSYSDNLSIEIIAKMAIHFCAPLLFPSVIGLDLTDFLLMYKNKKAVLSFKSLTCHGDNSYKNICDKISSDQQFALKIQNAKRVQVCVFVSEECELDDSVYVLKTIRELNTTAEKLPFVGGFKNILDEELCVSVFCG